VYFPLVVIAILHKETSTTADSFLRNLGAVPASGWYVYTFLKYQAVSQQLCASVQKTTAKM